MSNNKFEQHLKFFATRLKMMKKDCGDTTATLSKALGIATGTIYNWESCQTKPTCDHLLKLSDFYKVSIDWLLGNEDYDCEEVNF